MLLVFAACTKKGNVTPNPKPVVIAPIYDTIPDGAYFAVRFVQDSTYNMYTIFGFNHTALLKAYVGDGDGRYMAGFTPDVFYAITIDNSELAWDYVPYSRGMVFNLHVSDTNNGLMFLAVNDAYTAAIHDIPPSIHIWCKDNYLKDSVEMTHGAHCNFTIDNSNPNTFGDHRFQIVLWADKKN